LEPAATPSRSIIAIVDDDLSVRRALKRVVEIGGYTVLSFASAEECLELLSRDRPACLLLDIHLLDDGMSGFDLQERLAAEGVSIPVIFITAHENAATRARIERSGAAGYLWKPVDAEALLRAIRRATGDDPRTRRLASSSEAARGAMDGPAPPPRRSR
jgi:FixJ family two-component response regulator